MTAKVPTTASKTGIYQPPGLLIPRGTNIGFNVSFNFGFSVGLDLGFSVGLDFGFSVGVDSGLSVGFVFGFVFGFNFGFDAGFVLGVNLAGCVFGLIKSKGTTVLEFLGLNCALFNSFPFSLICVILRYSGVASNKVKAP